MRKNTDYAQKYRLCKPKNSTSPGPKSPQGTHYSRNPNQPIGNYYLLLIAACAAASLAIGTRNGEQDT